MVHCHWSGSDPERCCLKWSEKKALREGEWPLTGNNLLSWPLPNTVGFSFRPDLKKNWDKSQK